MKQKRVNDVCFADRLRWVTMGYEKHINQKVICLVNVLAALSTIFQLSSSDNKSVSHWIMFDYFFHV